MLKTNSFFQGFLLGILIPILAYGIFYGLISYFNLDFPKPGSRLNTGSIIRTAGIVAIGLNSIPMNLAYKRKQTNTMRGIVIPTFLFVALWLYYYGDIVMSSFG